MLDELTTLRRPGPPGPDAVKSSSGKGEPPRRNPVLRPRRWWVGFVVVLIVNFLLVQVFLPEQAQQRIDVPYTFFKQQVVAGNVLDVTSRGDVIQGTFKQPIAYPTDQPNAPTSNLFQTVTPQFADPGLETLLEQQGVIINAHSLDEPRSWWQTLLFSFGPTLLLIGLFIWISGRAASQMGGAGGPFGLGRSRAKRYDPTQTGTARITFADVAGIDEAKQELEEIVDFLRDPKKYSRLGGAVPKGVLLIGAPGTGKTLLARAVAGEANVPFFSMGASEFVEMIVGAGASRVRDLFKQAREAAPAIIFIDERQARYLGRTKTVFQVCLAAAVANLTLLAATSKALSVSGSEDLGWSLVTLVTLLSHNSLLLGFGLAALLIRHCAYLDQLIHPMVPIIRPLIPTSRPAF